MSNLLTVQDPDENAEEHATSTRALLKLWADKHLPVQDEGITELPDAEIKRLRAFGAQQLVESLQYQQEQGTDPTSEFSKLLLGLSAGFNRAAEEYPRAASPRNLSHALEGVTREFHKQFFQGKMQWNTHAEYLAVLSMQCPCTTNGYQDRLYRTSTGTLIVRDQFTHSDLPLRDESEWGEAWASLPRAAAVRFYDIKDWVLSVSGCAANAASTEALEYWANRMLRFDYVGCQIHYMDVDGPWVAGFLNLDDACRLRFRRIRLGAYLTEQGMADAAVRSRVERAKQQVAGAEFEAYPNDVDWEHLYTDGPCSCMSDSAGEYSTFDSIHPVSAYSSSYRGCGDNGLVLLISRDEDGIIQGRGILHLQVDSEPGIVRWYGDNVAERVLLRQGVDTSNRNALKGSWLALIQQGKRFIHPYVDGNHGSGKIHENRIYLTDTGEHCLQETNGSSYLGDTQFCQDTDSYEDADECTYQEHHDNYIHDSCDSWRCPVIGEWCRTVDRSRMTVHGISVEVSDRVFYNKTSYLTSIESGEYSIDDDDQRNEFEREYGEYEEFTLDGTYPTDEDDEEAA